MKGRITVSNDLAQCCVNDLKFHVHFREANSAPPKSPRECEKCGTVLMLRGGRWTLANGRAPDAVTKLPNVFLCVAKDRASGLFFVGEVTDGGQSVENASPMYQEIGQCRTAAVSRGKLRQLPVIGRGDGGGSVYLWRPEETGC